MSPFGAAIFGCSGLELTSDERGFFKEYNPFGFILFSRNIESADQLSRLCGDLRESVAHDAPILIDQEGGRVQRLRPPLARDWPAPLDHAEMLGKHASRGFYLRHRIIAQELLSYGIDTSCAPMLDVAQADTHAFLKNRCYGTSAEAVSDLGLAAAKGLSDAGVLPIAKHIPGHGRAVLDSHFDLPRTGASKSELAEDFAPFQALKNLPMAMTAHVVYEAYDDQPATTSETMIQLIREEIGFDGLLMCDDLSMQALSGTIHDRTRASLDAGCDVILHCNGDLAEMQSVAEEAGAMSEIGMKRATRALAARRPRAKVDMAALTAELDGLTGR